MVSSRNILKRQKTLRRVYSEKKAVQLPTNQGESSRYPAQTKDKSRGEQNTDLMEEVLSRQNILKALRRVEKNKGAPGIDNLTVESLKPYLRQNWLPIREQLLKGDYKPQPVLRVEISKPNGGKRLLGIPTVIDRLIQQALLQILTDIFDPELSPFSFGFRPNRKAHDAVMKAKQYIEEGYQWVVDLDIERFFDRINHDLIMARVARKVKDKRILKLIRLYLQSGVMINGVKVLTREGTPQGGPLSPLLANILLDDLDKELEMRDHKFIRYADDSNIYLKSKRAGQRVMESITTFLKVKLRLQVNLQKSAEDMSDKRKFLGFVKLRLPDWAALGLANTRKAYWHIAGDSLNSALPNAYWANLGLMSLTNRYCKICSACFVNRRIPNGTYGGVSRR